MEIDKMRAAGKLAAETLNYACSLVKPGVCTEEIDDLVREFILSKGATPAPLGYKGFPKSICTSVNHIICHGVPDGAPLSEGDSVAVDVTVILDGHYGDTARTIIVGGEETPLLQCAREATMKAIQLIKPGTTMGDLGFAINKFVTRKGFHVVDYIGGHSIGTFFHGPLFTPSFGKRGKGEALKEGMCITIEPLIKESPLSTQEVQIKGSEITCTYSEGRGAQFEHTVLVTKDGFEILTL